MFDALDASSERARLEDAHELLRDLEKSTPQEIRRQRAHFRIQVKCPVIIQPGNASDLLNFKVKAVTGDISEGGCSVLSPVPLRVGDVYRVLFDAAIIDLPMMFVRCLRCRLVREDAFETGLSFFSAIALPDGLAELERSGSLPG